MKYLQGIKKGMKNLAVCLIGNKINLLSTTALLAGVYLTADDEIKTRLEKKLHEESAAFVSPSCDEDTDHSAAALFGMHPRNSEIKEVNALAGLLSVVGLYGMCSTTFGLATLSHYRRGIEHIKRRGELEQRYLEKLIGKTENGRFVGYCQLQGAYLAARETGQLDVFREAKRKFSRNCLPNF